MLYICFDIVTGCIPPLKGGRKMSKIEEILQSKIKPKEKQAKLIKAVVSGKISIKEFIAFFESAKDVDKGTCADVMKHVSAEKPELFLPYIDLLAGYINYKAQRVKWGVPESFGNIAKKYPKEAKKAVPNLLKNTVENKDNTTVIRWCAAYALSEIAKSTKDKELINNINNISKKEKNNGVKNVYVKALKIIHKE
jgi:flagellar biosynthesis component FlhA